MKDKHTSKNHASFTPQRQNKYSIRKFTFGTASILVGATLFLGVNHDAKAAENVPTSTEISTTPDPGQEVEQAHADEVAFEAEVLNDSVVKTDEESTTVKKEEIQEEGGQVENTSLPENQPSNENTEKAVEEKHLEPKVQNAAPKSENVQVSKEKVSVPQPTIVKETEETNKIDLNSAIKIDQVKDLETATNFYAQSAGVSIADAKEFIKDLNLKESITPAELQQALIYQLSLEYETMYHPVAVIEGTERKDVKIIDGQRTTNYAAPLTINNPDVILADAMLNGYVSSGSDELSKAHLISGRAWMTDQGIPSVGTNGLTPVPVNTPVFLQWMDRDGAISPIYLAYTHNRNNDDSAQDGPGGYAFDLRNGWTDAKGKKHLYSAFAGQKYRFAIPDFTLPNGNRATMLRQSGGFYPGVFVDTFTINNMGQTPVVGKNIGRTGIFMAEVPVGNYMTKPKNQWVEANGNHSDPGILAIDGYNIVRGRVWMESSGGDRSNSATGPNFNPNMGDKAANGYKVVFSSLTTQGASAYRNAVERLPEDQRATAAKRLLQDHPEYISATVVATTDSSGVYAAKFPSGTLNVEHIYGFVLNPKGKLVQTYSGFTSPEFRRANQNIEIAPIAAPYSGIQQWANVNFAVVLSPSDTIDIATKPYNATNNPAAPGNRVEVELTNGDVPPMPTHIEWRDKNGNVVSKSRDFTTPKEGEKVGGFTIPNNAEEGDTYTAVLVSGGNDIGGDTVVVHVTDSNKYPPKATVVNKAFGQPTNENDVISHVTFPNYPANHKKPNVVVDHPDQLPDGSVPGRVEVPVTVTYPDGSTATIKVPVVTADQQDKDKYQPTTESIEKNYGEKATPDEVKGKVTVPNFPANGKQPTYTVDEAKIPNGLKSGTENVPVTVTYPDGSKEVVEVPVITKEQLDKDKYQPTTEEIRKPFGQRTDENEVKSKVAIPGYPENGQPVTITVDTSKIPDGQTPGEVNVPVTVTYPDNTTDVVNVKVTTGPKDSDTYQPTTAPITKPYGQGTTEQEIKDKVTVPNFPKDGVQPKVVIDDPTKVPDGNTTGVFDVPVTVTYPDGTTDKVTVKVTVGKQADNAKYEPTAEDITKKFGQKATPDEVKGKVTVPGFPKEGNQPVLTVDESKIPNGQTPGEVNVPVTVTYPDKTTDVVNVKVTTGPKDSDTYQPTTTPITKPYGQGTTEQEVKDKVTVPNFPKDGVQPKVTVDDPTKVPDGNTTGVFDVPVTVTYPDGTTDKVTVKVTVGKQADNAKYDPKAGEITKKFGQKATPDEVKGKVTVPGFPKDGDQPVLTVDETKIPDGQTPGEVNVPVTVTYPDHTTDVVNVKVTTGPKDSDTYQPTTEPITKPYGQGTTEQEVKDKVTVPNFPAGQDQPTVTVDDPTKVPAGNTTGVFDVPVTVTYPDGTTDKVTVKVTVNPQPENEQYEPIAKEVEKSYGQPTTPGDVVSQVTVPGYPTTGEQPKVSIDDPTSLPNGQTPGEYDIPVTVTYPDGTKDHVTVHVIVKPQPDTDIYVPSYNDVKVNPGQSVEVPQTGDKVPVGSTFEIIGNSAGGNGWTATIDPHTGTVKVTAPKDAHEGDKVIVKVLVHYPDGTTDNIGVHVTVHDSIAPEAPVINPIEAGSKVVTGTGKEPGTTVAVTFPNGEVVTTTVDNNGNWKVDVPNNITLTHGDKVIAVITDEAGNVSERTEQPVKDTICPEAPKVNVIHNGDKEISGTAEPGTTVTVTFPDGSTASSLVDENGHYTVKVPNHVTLKADDKVTAIATDEAGNVSKVTTAVVVGDKEGVPTPSGSKVEKAPAKRISNNQDRIDKQSSVTKGQNSDKVSEKATSAKVEKAENKSAQTTRDKALPETGNAENTSSGILVGGLFALLGSLLLFRKRQNKNEKKNN